MKIKKQNNKVAVLALSSLLVIGAVAGTIAMFNADFEVGNTFKVGKPNAKMVEEFDAPKTDIIYGGEFKKAGSVHNLGDGDIYAKMNVEATWSETENGFNGILNPTEPVEDNKLYAATLKFENTANITGFKPTNIGVDSSGVEKAPWRYDDTEKAFLYYGDKGSEEEIAIPSNESSKKFLESVKFADNPIKTVEEGAKPGMFYIGSEFDAGKGVPEVGATGYPKSNDAADATKGSTDPRDDTIYFYQLSEFKYPDYKGKLDVKITSKIQSEPFTNPVADSK